MKKDRVARLRVRYKFGAVVNVKEKKKNKRRKGERQERS